MRIVVCLNPTTGAAVDDTDAALRAGATPVSALRACDTHAVEAALQLAEAGGDGSGSPVEIVALTLAPAEALGAVREALALGADRGVIVDDSAVRHLDLAPLSAVLAAALGAQDADLYLTCTDSRDVDGLLAWTAAGAHLGVPVLTGARSLSLVGGEVIIERQAEDGDQILAAALPCAVEVTETLNQARYPTVKGRAAAQNKPVELVRPAALVADVADLARSTELGDVGPADRDREAVVITDADTAVADIVAFLRDRNLV